MEFQKRAMKRRERTNKKIRRRKAAPSNKHSNKRKSVDDVIALADSAMEAMDVSRALNLYSSAVTKLRNRLEINESLKQKEEDDEVVDGGAHGDREKLCSVLGKLGEAKVSQGDQDGARQDFGDAIALLNNLDVGVAPSIHKLEMRGGFFLYLGQLSSDYEALDAYKKGIDDFKTCLSQRQSLVSKSAAPKVDDMVDDENNDDHDQQSQAFLLQETRQQLCRAYCTVGELYLTDLCYDDNAESQCEHYINEALKLVDNVDGQPLVDALQSAASLRLSQQRGVDASQLVLQAFDKMEKGCKALAELVGLGASTETTDDTAVELVEVDAANNLPGFEFRCQTAKILLECATALKCADVVDEGDSGKGDEKADRCTEAAVQVLGSLLAENDEVVEIWYLTGCAFAATDPPNIEMAEFYWGRALEMLKKVKEELEEEAREFEGNDEEVERIRCEIQEVSRQADDICVKLQQIDDSDDVWPMEDGE